MMTSGFRKLALSVGLALALVLPAGASERVVPQSRAEVQLSFAPLVRQAAPAVVNIYTRRVVEQVVGSPLFNDPFFKRFFGNEFPFGGQRRQRQQQNSLGSGVIVTADGLIVTNHHVIAKADEITVALGDRREFDAELVLSDEGTDLAILRIDAGDERLPFLELRDSDTLEVGDLVLAIGNPFNVGQTVTSGIVSALARTGVGRNDFQFFIQTDAAINPGNSGGALIDMSGYLVGVNTAIFSRSGGSHGIGFAVPARMVEVVLRSARSGFSHVRRAWFGARVQDLSADLAQSLGLNRPSGALIAAVRADSPAERAGLDRGDVVAAVDGFEIEDAQSLRFRLGALPVGGSAALTVWRDGNRREVRLPLEQAPEQPPREETTLKGRHPLSGATVANLSPALAEELGIDVFLDGVIVLKLARNTPAARLRLRPGDRILALNERDIDSVASLTRALAEVGRTWRVVINRGGRQITVEITG